jgi:hypothetical protein
MARKRDEAASGKMTLEQRLTNYRAGGRNELTPRQLRRAAHKAKVSTAEIARQSARA